MILGIGTDLLAVRQISACYHSEFQGFFRRAYSRSERQEAARAADPVSYYASRFAGKEAVLKCLAAIPEPLCWQEIEICSDAGGRPHVRLSGQCQRLAQARGIRKIHLSISRESDYVTAFAVAEG